MSVFSPTLSSLRSAMAFPPLAIQCSLWYMYNGAPPHYSFVSRQYLDHKFSVKDRTLDMYCSPDFNPLDHFWGDNFRQFVYATTVSALTFLSDSINQAFIVTRNTSGILERVRQFLK